MRTQEKILFIDDEEVVLDSCTQGLEGRNYQIAIAMDGTIGLKRVREFQPDLVFVDLKMPGISGFEVLEKIRSFDPTIVAIVITGYATVSSAVEAMKNGAFDFLPKPFTPDELRLITQRGLEKRRLVLESMALRREKEMLRENFAAVVSHELKAPLSAVQQNLFALAAELASQLTEAQKSRLERMKSRIGDLLKLIQTWLGMVSVDLVRIKERFAPVAVAAPLSKAMESLQPHAARRDIEVIASGAGQASFVCGDEGSLTEAFLNVVGNAIKYSRAGGKVLVRVERQKEHILIAVSDMGVGISKEDLPFVFDDFYRGRSDLGGEQGCGLGLAITRRIVEAHDGSISVESEPGHGSTFTIRLPALRTGGCAPAPVETGVLTNSQSGGVL